MCEGPREGQSCGEQYNGEGAWDPPAHQDKMRGGSEQSEETEVVCAEAPGYRQLEAEERWETGPAVSVLTTFCLSHS